MDAIIKDLAEQFTLLETVAFRAQHTLCVAGADAHGLIEHLQRAHGFDYLVDVTGLDQLKHPEDRPERFAAVYHLCRRDDGARLRVRAYLPEERPTVQSITDLYPAANWLEREAYDMYGIEFAGHPNLTRILMPDEYEGHPLRKDYPLKGRGERDNFPKYFDIPEE